jgi:hypothetical protein
MVDDVSIHSNIGNISNITATTNNSSCRCYNCKYEVNCDSYKHCLKCEDCNKCTNYADHKGCYVNK